jgi:hypothetical protein
MTDPIKIRFAREPLLRRFALSGIIGMCLVLFGLGLYNLKGLLLIPILFIAIGIVPFFSGFIALIRLVFDLSAVQAGPSGIRVARTFRSRTLKWQEIDSLTVQRTMRSSPDGDVTSFFTLLHLNRPKGSRVTLIEKNLRQTFDVLIQQLDRFPEASAKLDFSARNYVPVDDLRHPLERTAAIVGYLIIFGLLAGFATMFLVTIF